MDLVHGRRQPIAQNLVAVEGGIVDGDRDLVGQRLQHGEVVGIETLDAVALDVEHTQQTAAHHQGNARFGADIDEHVGVGGVLVGLRIGYGHIMVVAGGQTDHVFAV